MIHRFDVRKTTTMILFVMGILILIYGVYLFVTKGIEDAKATLIFSLAFLGPALAWGDWSGPNITLITDKSPNYSWKYFLDPTQKKYLLQEIVIKFPVEFKNNGKEIGVISSAGAFLLLEDSFKDKIGLKKEDFIFDSTNIEKDNKKLDILVPIELEENSLFHADCTIRLGVRKFEGKEEKEVNIKKLIRNVKQLKVRIEYKVSTKSAMVQKSKVFKLKLAKFHREEQLFFKKKGEYELIFNDGNLSKVNKVKSKKKMK